MFKNVRINFFGGPGVGKSTTALGLTFALKQIPGIVSEYIPEYAKECVWGDTTHTLDNQLYIAAKQHHRQFKVDNKVDFVVTDAPLLMQLYYGDALSKSYKSLIKELHVSTPTVNILLTRNPYIKYESEGRLQNLEEASEIDTKLKAILDDEEIPYYTVESGEFAVTKVLDILYELGYLTSTRTNTELMSQVLFLIAHLKQRSSANLLAVEDLIQNFKNN